MIMASKRYPNPTPASATDLVSGREVWLREGPVIDAVRASIALPGVFTPAIRDERLLVDGGLVNPVPVSLCRAMGADLVIAVDLNWNLVSRRSQVASATQNTPPPSNSGVLGAILARLRPGKPVAETQLPSMLDVLTTSLNIMQLRITQSRLAGEPADAVIRPRLADVASDGFFTAAPRSSSRAPAPPSTRCPLIREMLGDGASG